MNMKKEKSWEVLWCFSVFAFFFVWFSKIHPLIVYNADDWTYLAYVRSAVPIWGAWNPSKVFPEVLFPFFSTIILHTLVPLTGDYITGFTVGHALVVSGFITAYAFCLVTLLRRIFSLSKLNGIFVGTLFLIFHFLIFRTMDADNPYLFLCADLNCYYNYLLPALLNACLLMYMMHNPHFDKFLTEWEPVKKGIFYLLIYFAIFSNLVVNGILAAYAGSKLLLSLLKERKAFRLTAYTKKNAAWLIILVMWFICAIFELSGGRASSASQIRLLDQVHEAAYFLKIVLINSNPLFWVCVFVITTLALLQFLLTKKKSEDEAVFFQHAAALLVAGAALSVYFLILCAIVYTGYVYRSEYQFPLFFYSFLMIFLELGYLLKKQPKFMVILPLCLVFLVSSINTKEKTFADALVSNYGASICADISRDIVRQYLDADAVGLKETTIYVPVHTANLEEEDNWPHSLALLHRISQTLYEQGVLSQPIDVTFVADPAMNERYHIPIPTE